MHGCKNLGVIPIFFKTVTDRYSAEEDVVSSPFQKIDVVENCPA